jgi:hypothetical protein
MVLVVAVSIGDNGGARARSDLGHGLRRSASGTPAGPMWISSGGAIRSDKLEDLRHSHTDFPGISFTPNPRTYSTASTLP